MSEGAVYVTFGGDSSQLEATLATSNAAIAATARELRSLSREMVATGASAESELGRHVLAVASHLTELREGSHKTAEALHEVTEVKGGDEREFMFLRMGESLKSMLSPVIELKGNIGELVEVFAAAFAVEKIADWAVETVEAMEKVENESHKLGVSIESVERLQGVATLSGVNYDEMAQQLERLQIGLARVDARASPVGAALKALGVNIAEFRTANIDTQLDLLAEAFSRFRDGARKTAAAEALGRTFVDLLPVLDKGKEGLDELRKKVEESGAVMSGKLVSAMAQTSEDMKALGLAAKAAADDFYSDWDPAIDKAVVGLTRLLNTMHQVRETSLKLPAPQLDESYYGYSPGAAKNAGPQPLESAATRVSHSLGGDGIQPLPQGDLGRSSAGDGLARTKAAADAYAQSLSDIFTNMKGRISGAAEAAQKPEVPQMNIGGAHAKSGDAGQAARNAFEEDTRAAQISFQETETGLNGLLQRHEIGMSQWLAQSVAALDKEQDAIQDAAAKALASTTLTSQQKIEISNRERDALAAIAHKISEDQNKAAEATARQWQAAFQSLNSAVDGQIGQLLSRTENWGTALRNVLASVTQDVIKFFVNWGLQAAERFVMNEALNNAWVQSMLAGNAAIAASSQASSAASGLGWVASALKTLEANAAQVFGGVFAFLSPELGPAAAGPAAAAAATVTAGLGAVASADIGMWSVPHDQLALVHHNELIMPATQAGAFRDMLSGGGGQGGGGDNITHNHTWNIQSNAADPRDVARQVADLWNRNPSFRPSY